MIMIMFMIVMSLMRTKNYAKRHVEKSWISTVQTLCNEKVEDIAHITPILKYYQLTYYNEH